MTKNLEVNNFTVLEDLYNNNQVDHMEFSYQIIAQHTMSKIYHFISHSVMAGYGTT